MATRLGGTTLGGTSASFRTSGGEELTETSVPASSDEIAGVASASRDESDLLYMIGGCWEGLPGLFAGVAACWRLIIWGYSGRNKLASVEIATAVRERVLRRSRSGSGFVDIHTLLVRPDPSRSIAKTYRTVCQLGKGGFGSVWRVNYLPTGEERAIKMIQKPSDEIEQARVVFEVEALVRLDHPNIEKFYEYFEDDRVICLVTELVTGGNIGELDPTENSPEEIRLLFQDVVAAVAYCHSEGVVHRDLKFENCLLTEKDGRHRRTAKVIDFGLSSFRPSSDDDCWMREAVGTVFFIAPEVLKSDSRWQPKYGPKCDMWSIGVMMYIVFTDRHPFARSAASNDQISYRVRREPVRASPLRQANVDEVTRDLIMRLLEKNPAKRLSAEEARAHPYFEGTSESAPSGMPGMSPGVLRSLMGRVCSFARYSRFEKAMLTIVAHDIQRREVEDLRAAFNALDSNKAGWLTRDGFEQALIGRGIRLRGPELQAAFEALDPDEDDKIQYTDWLAATLRPSALVSERAMKEVWDFFDLHGVGKVSLADIAEVLGDDVASSFSLPENCEVDDEGRLSWDVFQNLMRQVALKLQKVVDEALKRQHKDIRASRRWLRGLPRNVASSLRWIEAGNMGDFPPKSKSAEVM
mmetsp:Transcript_124051/g.356167  ORF Transcript_124051/g.356167 Transcript_124051/m.356167 type:complete len:638 (-) Transcript_124051:66-1979(-)